MKTCETLKAVRELLSEEKRWTQKEYARDAVGNGITEHAMRACSWCLLGAISKLAESEEVENASVEALAALMPAQKYAGEEDFERLTVIDFNDTHPHSEVLQLLDKAIDGQ